MPAHVDIHYYWRTHLRIHIPIITNPEVSFTCGDETVHMAAGECWLLDSFFRHSVDNRGSETRVHLVLDTVGSGPLWDLIEAGASGSAEERFVAPGTAAKRPLQFEQINTPAVMSPWEMKAHVAYITGWTDDQPGLEEVAKILDRFIMAWGGTWARHGASDEGLPQYLRHLGEVRDALAKMTAPQPIMRNEWPMVDSLQRYVLALAIDPAKLRQLQAAAAARAPRPSYRMTA